MFRYIISTKAQHLSPPSVSTSSVSHIETSDFLKTPHATKVQWRSTDAKEVQRQNDIKSFCGSNNKQGYSNLISM